jgi:SAM-dependent methyltransferase
VPGRARPSGGTIDWDAPPRPPHAPTPRPGFGREQPPQWLAVERPFVTETLHARLGAEDVDAVARLIGEDAELAASFGAAPDERARQQMTLAYGIWLGHDPVAEKTGLPVAQPPEDVHLMARGPLASAGGMYEADMIASAAASVGVAIQDLRSVLDFGCSSGRVVRVLAAAYPGVTWYGCDPNEPAIAWATQNLRATCFFVSGDEPPLPLEDASLDLAYAISIWSHFEPGLALRWFEELRRLLRPGGLLVLTTHGWTSLAFYSTNELRPPDQSKEIGRDLYRQGWWYKAEFGKEGDWGVVNPAWGTAFLTPEWLLTQLCPRWRVVEFAAGRNQENQDVYVLERA